MSSGHQRIKWRRNVAENFNRLSRVHERYRQTTDRRQTDGRRHIANMNMSSRSLKTTEMVMQILEMLKQRQLVNTECRIIFFSLYMCFYHFGE